MVSLDLKEVYLQVLRFVAFGRTYPLRAVCFGLSTGVMAPVSSIPHSLGIRLRRYLDDWLIQASSREAVLSSLETVLSLSVSSSVLS